MLFARKASTFEAVQFANFITDELQTFLNLKSKDVAVMAEPPQHGDTIVFAHDGKSITHAWLWVEKSHMYARVTPGMWIVKELDGGGFYPMTDDILKHIAQPLE